jgi:hypothetical protein
MRYFLIAGVVVAVTGCSSASQEGAARGATMGAVGGAVAGAVSSLIFGGNVVQGAAQGAAIGVASGAATGAVAGSMADSAAKKPAKPAAGDAELRKRIGDRNYASALLLAQCKHKDAIASAEDTLAVSKDSNERAFALLLQGVAAEESGDKALATSMYPKIAQQSGGSVDKARADSLEGVIKVQAERRKHGMPPC